MSRFKYYAFLIITILLFIKVLAQEENRDTKQHPELTKLVKHWAQKLGIELWHNSDVITRRNKAIECFQITSVIKEDGEKLLDEIHEKISNMMQSKVDAVKRIMEVAEQAAKDQKEEDIDFNFQFFNAKNLTNSAPNYTVTDQVMREPEVQELKYDDSFVSTGSRYEEHYQAMVQPEEIEGYQQDQDQQEETPNTLEEPDSEIEVTDGTGEIDTEKDPQASQIPHNDKTKLPLYPHRHFYNYFVNTNYSVVHVPSNVYERSKDVIAGIKWSEELDKTFRFNYKSDPSLSWQYFGSSTGFMRQFPAIIWPQNPIDLFDCRMRSWFIEAASSPKDVVILVDRSGSMTGMRREIARHVVHNILDTLGNNDYVNIFTFSNTTDPLIECFDNLLVQANLANVRILKEGMSNFKTEQIANFSLALVTAFELLEEYRELKKGANCNQAIMLITDGVQYNYKEIFEKYNWQNLPFVNVRVFTYLIGREVSDVREVKWMACANRGYYVHLSTYAEVREEVLHYIPVMARPMVLNPTQKPHPTWSPIYADVTDPKLTNWLWVNRERNRQRERFLAYKRNKTLLPLDDREKKFIYHQNNKENWRDQPYHLMTSVSLPVYDKKPRAERVANLLGVAGTDIPIEYIEKMILAYKLGVNAYGFIVSNNGYILIHPDFRPVYQGILKPAYNRVDITEVEIMDDDSEPRDFSEEIRELRKRIVMQKRGNATLHVKSHIDDMRRIVTGVRHYFYRGLNDTPFTLVIALPHRYGLYRIQHPVESDIHRMRSNNLGKESLGQFFTGSWSIHPDWNYCQYLGDKRIFLSPEDRFGYFLNKMELAGWKWSTQSQECDRKLVCKVVADAKVTTWFNQNITDNTTATKEEDKAEIIKYIRVTVAFLATPSGLTRWQDLPQNIHPNQSKIEPHFSELHNKAIDEIWYRRAVEYYYTDQMAFVFSVPFDVGEENNTLVTVSHAIFREDAGKRTPAAVIGYQFYHSNLYNLFKENTASCGGIPCKRTCESNELHCLLLDDNGYVIVSDNLMETGFFFGSIRPDIMSHLVDEGIYKVTKMYDYQGLCPEEQETNNPASPLFTPMRNLRYIADWLIGFLITFARNVLGTELETVVYPETEDHEDYDHHELHEHDDVEADDQPASKFNEKEFDQRLLIKKTKPEPCDNIMWLYSMVHYTERNISNSGYNKTMTDCTRPFIVQKISNSNLILLVINNLCREDEEKVAKMPDPEQMFYDNMSLSCYRVLHNDFPRRHYMSCINRNINESEIKLCGGANSIQLSRMLISIIIPLLSTYLLLNYQHS